MLTFFITQSNYKKINKMLVSICMLFTCTVYADSIYQNRMSNNLSLKILASETGIKLNQLNLNNLVKYKFMLLNQNNPTLLREILKKYTVQKLTKNGKNKIKSLLKFNRRRNKRRY